MLMFLEFARSKCSDDCIRFLFALQCAETYHSTGIWHYYRHFTYSRARIMKGVISIYHNSPTLLSVSCQLELNLALAPLWVYMGHLLKLKCTHSPLNVRILSSTCVPFPLTTVQVPNIAPVETKRDTVQVFEFFIMGISFVQHLLKY
jgi:hypothetical protein